MICPKCDEGRIITIKFKRVNKTAYVCDYCDALWFDEESINRDTNHTLRSYSQDEDLEYTIEKVYEREQEYEQEPINYKL